MLKKTLNAYHNRAIATQMIGAQLVKEMDAATKTQQGLG